MTCQYCYQTPSWDHGCSGSADCPAVSSPRRMFKTNCSVKSEVICLGNRNFPKRIPCNWTSGYQWSTVLLLSITLGGFGADRLEQDILELCIMIKLDKRYVTYYANEKFSCSLSTPVNFIISIRTHQQAHVI
ncbi:TM2 domain-containing protein 3 [Armadillidium vulgare]|nr:TM2 domain-containing protein 3 [Armadillidium vulgare]